MLVLRCIAALLLFAECATAQDLLNGLIVHYPMSGNAQDIGPNGFHGSVSGAVLAPDQDGNPNNAYYFDGINDFIDFPYDLLLKPDFPFTVAVVAMYDNTLIVEDAHVFTTDFEQDNYHGAFSSIVGQKQTISFGGGAGNTNPASRRTKTGTTSLVSGQWYRITFILRGATDMEIYIDCVNDGGTYSGTGPTNIAYTSVPGCLGRMDTYYGGPPHYFKGSISDFRMWDRELTEEEITLLCNTELPCALSVDLGADLTLCAGDQMTLDVSSVTGQYLWQDGSTAPEMGVEGPGTYHVTVTHDGCTASDTIVIMSAQLPEVSLGSDTILCDAQALMLSVDQADAQVAWSNGSAGQVLEVSESGQYWVMVQVEGCPPVADTVSVLFFNSGPFTVDTVFCAGLTIAIGQQFTDASYLWSTGETTPHIEVGQPGTYLVEIASGPCSVNGEYMVDEVVVPMVDIGADTAHCFALPLVLFSGIEGLACVWSDGSNDDSLTVEAPGIYTVYVAVNGCYSFDTVDISEGICPFEFVMPNVFTPNDDDINDLFTPVVSENVVGMEFKVYNRWGLLLFESNDPDQWWDGVTTTGARASDGTYFWIAEVSDFEGAVHPFHGTVTLLQ